MTTVRRLVASALVASALACGAALPGAAVAQQSAAKDLVGSWTLVSATLDKLPGKADVLGPDPEGRLMLGPDGRFALITLRSDLPRFASGSRVSGTARENKAIVQGSVAYFGTYSVDEAAKALVFRIEAGTYPNWNGVEQRRGFTLSGDTLTYTTPGTHGAGATRGVWRRASYGRPCAGSPAPTA